MSTPTSPNPAPAAQSAAQVICPHLGLANDPQTCYWFPSTGNYCHNAIPPQPLNVDYQKHTCLTDEHNGCKIFNATRWEGAFPIEIGGPIYPKRNLPTSRNVIALGASLVVLISIVIVLYLVGVIKVPPLQASQNGPEVAILLGTTQSSDLLTRGITSTIVPESPTPIFGALFLPTRSIYIPSRTPAPAVAITPTPEANDTKTSSDPPPGPDMGTPFGPNNQFILHTVQAGESLSLIAETYQTTIEVIRASNRLIEGASVWPGTVLVLTRGETRPDSVGQFIVLLVGITTNVSSLSEDYGVSPEEIRYLNNLGTNDEVIPAGRWIIIPVMDDR